MSKLQREFSRGKLVRGRGYPELYTKIMKCFCMKCCSIEYWGVPFLEAEKVH